MVLETTPTPMEILKAFEAGDLDRAELFKLLDDAIPHVETVAEDNILRDAKGNERAPGTDPVTGEYSTAQMLRDEMFGGNTSQPLDD